MKNIKIFKRIISCAAVTILFIGTCHGKGVTLVNAENRESKKNYIVAAIDDQVYDQLLDEIDEEAVEENAILSENNIMVAELLEEEAALLDRQKGVIVEEDFELTANEVQDDTGGEEYEEETGKEKEGSEAKKALYERIKREEMAEQEDFEPDWNMQAINVDEIEAADEMPDESRVRVAVLDSGVDWVDGLELAGAVNFVEEEEDITVWFQDLTGHGTNIASVIAGSKNNAVQGINPNVDLYSVKVLDENNTAPLSRIIEGLYWCIDHEVDIINMSFGTSRYSYALKDAVASAYEANILMVGAAGNHAGEVEYPAAFDEVMAVAATNTESEVSSFSNMGEELDIAAPGEKSGYWDFSDSMV